MAAIRCIAARGPRARRLATVCGLIGAAGFCSGLQVWGQLATPALPPNYRVILDNAAVQVIHVHYGPHEKVALHDHSSDPTVYVYLSNSGPVRFTHAESRAEGGAGVLTRPPIKAGAFRVSPGRRERHSVENLGNIPSDFLRVELKGMPFATLEPYRGEAPADLNRSGLVTEVNSPKLAVDRIVCAGAKSCSFPATHAPSLVVAFTPTEVTTGAKRSMGVGEVAWIDGGRSLAVRASPRGPAHLLRIEVKPTQNSSHE